MRPVRVVVIDSHEIARVGLRAVLRGQPDLHVIGMAAVGVEGLALVEELEPDVVLVDYTLGEMSGVQVCALINERHPAVQVIVLAAFLDDEVVRRSVHAGAKAYLSKDVDGRELQRVIRGVAQGESMLDPKVVSRVMRWPSARERWPERSCCHPGRSRRCAWWRPGRRAARSPGRWG